MPILAGGGRLNSVPPNTVLSTSEVGPMYHWKIHYTDYYYYYVTAANLVHAVHLPSALYEGNRACRIKTLIACLLRLSVSSNIHEYRKIIESAVPRTPYRSGRRRRPQG